MMGLIIEELLICKKENDCVNIGNASPNLMIIAGMD